FDILNTYLYLFFFSSRRRHTRSKRDWSSDVCSSDLGIGHRARRHPLAIAIAPGAHLFDLVFGLLLVFGQVADAGLDFDAPRTACRDIVFQLGDPFEFGQIAALVLNACQSRIAVLDVEQRALCVGCGFQRALLVSRSAATVNDHGSVTVLEICISTLSPSRSCNRCAATGNHVHSAAQCGTSTTAHASACSRCSLTG